jgi:hypothetical protein
VNIETGLWRDGAGHDQAGTFAHMVRARLTNEVQFLYDREFQWEQNTISSI